MFFFYIAEALRSIKSAKVFIHLTTVSLTISVLLILFSFITLQLSDYYSSSLKSNIKINVFLKETSNKNDQEKMLSELKAKNYTDSVEFISKDKAAEQFIQETGEDFRKILDYNPLPASFVVQISESYANSDSLNNIIQDLSSLESVDEVVFKEGFIYRLLNYIDTRLRFIFSY
jgi:cell division transport system permease protein